MTMGLIDKDALIEKLKSNSWDIDEWELPHEQVSAGLMANAYDLETVKKMPTVDAVPVILCCECRYFELDHFENFYVPTENGEAEKVPIITAHKICRRWGDGCRTSENGYCFMAERK